MKEGRGKNTILFLFFKKIKVGWYLLLESFERIKITELSEEQDKPSVKVTQLCFMVVKSKERIEIFTVLVTYGGQEKQ